MSTLHLSRRAPSFPTVDTAQVKTQTHFTDINHLREGDTTAAAAGSLLGGRARGQAVLWLINILLKVSTSSSASAYP